MDNELLLTQTNAVASHSCPCLCYLLHLKNSPYSHQINFLLLELHHSKTFKGSLFLLQSRVLTRAFKAFNNQLSSHHFRLNVQCSITGTKGLAESPDTLFTFTFQRFCPSCSTYSLEYPGPSQQPWRLVSPLHKLK